MLTGYLYCVIPKGFFPEQDTGFLFGELEARQDISFAAIARINRSSRRSFCRIRPCAGLVGFAGATGGNSSENTARMFIQLKPFGERPPIEQVMERLRPKVAKVIGAKFYMQAGQDVTVGGRLEQAQYQYTLTDTNSRRTESLGADFAGQDAGDENSDRRRIRPADRLAAHRRSRWTATPPRAYGVSLSAIDATLYGAFGQQQIATIYSADPADQS